MDVYEGLIRPGLFRLDAERAHRLALAALRPELPWRLLEPIMALRDDRLRTRLAGIELGNPVGLAAGLDKTGAALPGLSRLGFGYVSLGSFTREPRRGNPHPRMFRDPARRALINSLGLPNPGYAVVARRLARQHVTVPVIASVAGFSADELLEGVRLLEPHVRAIEIGLVCPNTTAEEQTDELAKLSGLFDRLAGKRPTPIFVKLPPYHDPDKREHVLRMVDRCLDAGIDGVTVSGTQRVRDARLSSGEGSIAGGPILGNTLRIVGDVAERAGGRLAIKASGGIFTGEDALAVMRAGADAVEIYASFIYRGPRVARLINQELLAALDARPVSSIVRSVRSGAASPGTSASVERTAAAPPIPDSGGDRNEVVLAGSGDGPAEADSPNASAARA